MLMVCLHECCLKCILPIDADDTKLMEAVTVMQNGERKAAADRPLADPLLGRPPTRRPRARPCARVPAFSLARPLISHKTWIESCMH